MGKAVPTHHPAVVLRSHYNLVRALLAAAMVAVVALAATVVILAADNDTDGGATATRALPLSASNAGAKDGIRYDGGPEEGTRGLSTASPTPQQALRLRSEGMNEVYGGSQDPAAEGALHLRSEGMNAQFRGSKAATPSSTRPEGSTRYDGGPEEGTRGIVAAPPAGTRYDGGPEEGSRGPTSPGN
jgi:hypothetical protein